LRSKRLDPADDLVPQDRRRRLDASSRVSVQVAAAERAAGDADQQLRAVRLGDGEANHLQAMAGAAEYDSTHQVALSAWRLSASLGWAAGQVANQRQHGISRTRHAPAMTQLSVTKNVRKCSVGPSALRASSTPT